MRCCEALVEGGDPPIMSPSELSQVRIRDLPMADDALESNPEVLDIVRPEIVLVAAHQRMQSVQRTLGGEPASQRAPHHSALSDRAGCVAVGHLGEPAARS